MGGTTQTQEKQTSQQTQPWAPAQPVLTGILGNLGGINPQLTSTQSNAIQGLENNSGFLTQFGPQVSGITNNLLGGGGAVNQAGAISNNLNQYQSWATPYLNGSYLNPFNAPGFSDAYNTLKNDIRDQVNGQFAAAGRDLSGDNTQALARGETQGLGALINSEGNQLTQNQIGVANSLYNA